ncbi:hypothetical protein M426DRAFT_323653 [Hypoxylon sp. CI-4A]|nr:hypothetical protein M426DRAFT_323653 [Hypoxylon sp. CI-4A]
MFRFLRSRPNPFSLATRVHQSSAPAPQVMQIHRVKIRRKWFKPRNFVVAGCVYYVCYQVYKASVFGTLSSWLEEQDRQLTSDERDEMEEDIFEPIFISLPFTTRAVVSPPYKGSDPEWQAFIRVNKNRELVRGIQSSLAELVCKSAAKNPYYVQRCGSDMRLGRYWLDIQYPHRPPPTFVRKGLTLGDNGLSITEEPLSAVTAVWVQRSLWPSTLTMSLWSFSEALLKQNASSFARLFGYEPNPTPNATLQQAMEKVQQRLKKPTTESDPKESRSLSSAKTQAADGSSTDSTSAVEKRSPDSTSDPGSTTSSSSGVSSPIPIVPTPESDKPRSARDIYGIKHTKEHTSGPWMAFKRKFGQTWRPIREFPPRGSIYVSGLVEITTSRAFITVEASAWWDPKTRNFDMKSATFIPKMLRMKTQTPASR